MLLRKKWQYLTFFTVINYYSFIKSFLVTFSRLKTNVVFLMNVSKHKWVGFVDREMIWSDAYITVNTANNTNTTFVDVCCSIENQMIAPGAIFFHATYVIKPGGMFMEMVEQICSIGL